jgi:hypothetical protein
MAPSHICNGGMIELNIPSNVYLISNFGDATHASNIPCLRLFHTLAALPFNLKSLDDIFKNKSKG